MVALEGPYRSCVGTMQELYSLHILIAPFFSSLEVTIHAGEQKLGEAGSCPLGNKQGRRSLLIYCTVPPQLLNGPSTAIVRSLNHTGPQQLLYQPSMPIGV